MRKALLLLLLATLSVLTVEARRDKAPKEFPQSIIQTISSKDYTFTVTSMVGMPADVQNVTSLPQSYIIVSPNQITVNLPYYQGNPQQNSYNFSTFGRMLEFKSDNYSYTSSTLNKKGTLYVTKISTFAVYNGGFQCNLTLNVGPDGNAQLTVEWNNYQISYLGTIQANQ